MVKDDFVLTVDDEFADEEEYGSDAAFSPQPVNGKKRKRGDAAVEAKNSKKAKKQKGKGKNAPVPGIEDEDENPTGEDDGAIDPDFEFQLADASAGLQDFEDWTLKAQAGQQPTNGVKKAADIYEIIERRRKEKGDEEEEEEVDGNIDGEDGVEDGEDELLADDAFGMGAAAEDGEDEEEGSDAEDGAGGSEEGDGDAGDAASDDGDGIAAPVAHPDDVSQPSSDAEDDEEDAAEVERRNAFFAPEENIDGGKGPSHKPAGSFQEMALSRPILKGLSSVGFAAPTPIQHKTIPVALLGKDVVGGAQTGSGKTGMSYTSHSSNRNGMWFVR